MGIINQNFKKYPLKYLNQCLLAILTMIGILTFLDVLSHTALIASLGSSIFTVFSIPSSYMARMRVMIGGYIIGMASGIVCHLLSESMLLSKILPSQKIVFIIFAALSVGIAIFLMVITNSEHAPAAGMALGLVLNKWDVNNLIFIMGAVVFVAVIKKILRPYLIDLI